MSQAAPSQEQRFGRFNLYDIFANFLPGAILIFGLYLPESSREFSFPEVGVTAAATLAVIAFVLGFLLQALASPLVERLPRPFDKEMGNIQSPSGVEDDFATLCDKKFGIDVTEHGSGYEQWSLLFKSILSDLEASPWSRTLRIQALHLAARGLAMAFLVLSVCYGLYVVGVLQADQSDLFSRNLIPEAATVLAFGFMIIAGSRARHFEKDVVTYMISEFYMNNRELLQD
jgi:hypothetical protein